MSCFPCFSSRKTDSKKDHVPIALAKDITSPLPPVSNNKNTPVADANNKAEAHAAEDGNNTAKTFTFRELATATKNFRQECLLGECGIGRVFKGTLQSSGQIVAVRQLDRSGTQGSREFQVEVLMLSLLRHPNLVDIIGYCADGDQRLLVYEYLPSGSLKDHLFDISEDRRPLDWRARMRIASEYGLAKLLQSGSKMNISPRVMSAYGYCAPEYERHGELTLKSDVYSFGVVLLELITGRRAFDTARPTEEQNLVSWAQPIFRDPKMFPDMADPLLRKEFPVISLNQAVGVASMCLQEEPSVRPLITDVVAALGFLAMAPPEAPIPTCLVPMLSSRVETASQYGDCPSLVEGNKNISGYKQEDISAIEYEGLKNHPNQHRYDEVEQNGSPGFTYDDSSSSDDEDRNKDKSQHKLRESEKWAQAHYI
ncbi:hypothetical protein Pfo_015743 [Paulownia fortunei]|nr:hypothetical protein Pfo_015743 [Paulownia fortunei]